MSQENTALNIDSSDPQADITTREMEPVAPESKREIPAMSQPQTTEMSVHDVFEATRASGGDEALMTAFGTTVFEEFVARKDEEKEAALAQIRAQMAEQARSPAPASARIEVSNPVQMFNPEETARFKEIEKPAAQPQGKPWWKFWQK